MGKWLVWRKKGVGTREQLPPVSVLKKPWLQE